jgi:hypothetical protein
VETVFAHAYLLLFGKLAVGGLLSLAVPPFEGLERGYFRSTGAVYLGAALLMTAGLLYLAWAFRLGDSISHVPVAAAAWVIFCLLFTGYYVTLFVELPFLRARLFPWAVFTGLLALGLSASGHVTRDVGWLAGLPFAASACTGAAVLGAGVSGMLLGHWYLIESGLDLAPLERMLAYCRACLTAEVTTVLLCAALLWLWPGAPWEEGFTASAARYGVLVLTRWASWALAGFLLLLVRKTLAIPQTMAATGLFYIEALVVAVGQIVASWLLFRTGLPI